MIHLDPSSAADEAVPADPSPDDRRRAARALVEGQIEALTRLTGIGMDIAEAAGRRAVASADGEDLAAPSLAFARVARAVRMTIALQARLAKDLAALDDAEVKDRAAHAYARRRRIHRLVERAIEAEHDDEGLVEQLSDHVWERLTDGDEYGEVMSRPVAEIVARICADLGISLVGVDWIAHALAPSTPSGSPSPVLFGTGEEPGILTREAGEGDRGTRWRGRPLPQWSAEHPPTIHPSIPTPPESAARGPPVP